MLLDFSDDIVPLLIPAKSGTTLAVRVVLTSSKEDKELFEVNRGSFLFLVIFSLEILNCSFTLQRELQSLEEEQKKKVRGFREVIDLISASQKPVLSHNSLNGVFLDKNFST